MANIGELSVGVKVDQGSLNKATKDVQNTFKKTGDDIEQNFTNKTKKGFESIGSSLKGLGGILAGIFSVGAIVEFGKKLFGLGSDMTEISSKFDVVFQSSQKVREEFNELAKVTNRSQLELIDYGAGIGNVLAPLGLAQKEVDNLSLSMTKLAVDVASFNNVSDSQAVHAFTSALTGEREALKSLGIVISEDDVLRKAQTLGLIKQGQEMTKAQKALATYQLLLENTANAHNDAIRTGDSFANQMKGLRGKIKDSFAKAGQDVAGQTSGMIKKLSTFVSAYGYAIISTIVNTGKIIFSTIGEIISTIGSAFSFISYGSEKSGNDMKNVAMIFMKVIQSFGVGIKFIATVMKSLIDVIVLQLNNVVEIFMATFKSIGDGWNIVKIIFVGTLKNMISSVTLGAEVIGDVFVGMAEAIVGVFKGIADNVSVAIKKAVNLALKGINGFIDIVNKIPGVDINKLVGFEDANFKPFELKISKNIEKIVGKFTGFGDKLKDNYAGLGNSFQAIGNNFSQATANMSNNVNYTVSKVIDDWKTMGDEIQTSNDQITNSLENGAKQTQDNNNKTKDGYIDIMGILKQYAGGIDGTNKKSKEQGDIAKKAIDKIKDMYSEWKKKIDELSDAEKKLSEDTKKYNQDIEDSLRSLQKELQNTTEEYKKTLSEINDKIGNELADRNVEVKKDLLDLDKEISETKKDMNENNINVTEKLVDIEKEILKVKAEGNLDDENRKTKILDLQNKIYVLQLKIGENTDKTSESTKKAQKITLDKYNAELGILQTQGISIENQEKLSDLEKQRADILKDKDKSSLENQQRLVELENKKNDLLKEQDFIIGNTTENQRKEAERIAGLNQSEKIKEDEAKQIAEKTKAYEDEKKRIENLARINQVFLQQKNLDEKAYNQLISDERFSALTQEEQDLILKLARDKMQLTMQRDAIIKMQEDIHDATIDLSNNATAIQQSNIRKLKSEYAELLSEIQTAIQKQRDLAYSKSSGGYASGGYTGNGGVNEVAGLVHKGEWVAPKWMVNRMKPLFDNLESERMRGYASGGYTNTTNKTQNNNITVNSSVDLRAFLDYAKWKM